MQSSRSKRRKAGNKRGRYKLVIFFIDHRLDRGFTMFSNAGQDARGISVARFKELVLRGKFSGKVRWAGLYEREVKVWEYTLSENAVR